MKTLLSIIVSCVTLMSTMNAQMNIDGQILYGNEWVKYDQVYFKIKVSEDGIYRISGADLSAAGVPMGQINLDELQLFNYGKQIPIFLSNSSFFSDNDFIEFYGEKNRGALDSHLYRDGVNQQLNPCYSMFTDENVYFLTWEEGSSNNSRYQSISNNLTGGLPSKEAYYMHEEEVVFSDFHISPVLDSENVRYSHFNTGEGFGLRLTVSSRIEFPADHISSIGPDPYAIIRASGNNVQHRLEFSFNDDIKFFDEYFGLKVADYRMDLSKSELQSNNIAFVKGRGATSQTDRNTVGCASLFYARAFNANNAGYFEYDLDASLSNRYFELEDFSNNGSALVIDPANGLRLTADNSGNDIRFLLPRLDNDTKIVIANTNTNIRSINSIEAIGSFVDFSLQDPEFVIITSETLNSGDAVREYEDFRSSSIGGGLRTYTVEYEQLRDQFGYGIDNHSIGVTNFAQVAKSQWGQLGYFFIIGKALEYQVLRENVTTSFNLHVPTHGDPGSDHLLLADENDPFSYIPVGRLAANNEADISNYLAKSISHANAINSPQTIEDRAWTKHVIHLAGGDPQIQDRLLGHLNDMAEILEESTYAADVTTFQKVSVNPTQNPLSQQILGAINEGAAFVTFFGHSSAGTFDFSIEDPSKYENEGRLPVVISLGCHSGNIHTSSSNPIGISESFVLQENTGSIAFLASSGAAYISPQFEGGKILYNLIGNDLYGGTVGEIVNTMLKRGNTDIFIANNQRYRVESLLEQLTLHGDPATGLNAAPGPDFIVDFNSVSTNPKVVSTNLDSFEVTFDVINLGSKYDGLLRGLIIHQYGNNNSDSIVFEMDAPLTRSTATVMLPQKGIESTGKNILEIVLDYEDEIDELPDPNAELNNTIRGAYAEEGYCFFVFDLNAVPISPADFAIVNDPDLRLIASTNNTLQDVQQYEIQIDTTANFDSPLLLGTVVNSGGGMIEWRPEIQLIENLVYYWRVRNINEGNQNIAVWNGHSFIYLPSSSSGWNQSHYYQWRQDELNTAEIDESSRVFEFQDDFKSLAITNGVYADCSPLIVYQNEASEFIPWDAPVNAGAWVMVIDEFSGEPWRNQPTGLYNSTLNSSFATDFLAFPFWTRTSDERRNVIEMLENEIPDGAYVAFMTIQYTNTSYNPEEWAGDQSILGNSLNNILEQQGANRLNELQDGPLPYLFVYKKNDSSFQPIERVGSLNDCFTVDFEISAKWFEGAIKSTEIGPVKEWESLDWQLGSIENSDSISMRILGVDANGTETLIRDNITDQNLDLSFIDASQYPNLKLNFYAVDRTMRTAPYLNHWRVLYKELPEAVLNTNDDFVFEADTLNKGENVLLKAKIENIRSVAMDSLLVQYTIVDESNNEVKVDQRLAPLDADGILDLEYNQATSDLRGLYELRVEINANREQAEEHYFNNLGILNFYVEGDGVNPLLDVTFDGVRIFNGDIVSPEPAISVVLRDQEGVELDNPEDFEVVLQYPSGDLQTVDVFGNDVIFYPADTTSGVNEARLVYTPTLESGDYILYAQARDKSGNFSGDQDLSYAFRVVTESQISNVLNYPNPFSTSTQFIFTITGSRVPEDFHIKIFSLSGKVVKELTAQELGPLNIGVNRSRMRWDGRDEFGTRLANGVYLYKAYSSFDQEENSHFELDGIDQYFKNGFGKLVIMR